MASATHTLISTQTLGSAAATVTLSSIPTSYSDLKLVCSIRGDFNSFPNTVKVTLNSDTSNYSETYISGTTSNVFSSRGSFSFLGNSSINMDYLANTASVFGTLEIYIPNYNSTGGKQLFAISAAEQSDTTAGHWVIAVDAGLYRGASGITSITLAPNSGNFVASSTFYLYGIKNS